MGGREGTGVKSCPNLFTHEKKKKSGLSGQGGQKMCDEAWDHVALV